MKAPLLTLMAITTGFLLVSNGLQAQEKTGIRITASFGYAKFQKASKFSSSDQPDGGFVASIEPQLALGSIDIGLRVEQAFMKRPEILDEVLLYKSQAESILSGALTLTYRIGTSTTVRPYVGVGAGVYYVGKSEQIRQDAINSSYSYPLPAAAKPGGLARVGVALGPIVLEGAYNLVSDTSVENTVDRKTLVGKNSYFSLKAGYTFGRR